MIRSSSLQINKMRLNSRRFLYYLLNVAGRLSSKTFYTYIEFCSKTEKSLMFSTGRQSR